MTDTVSRGAVLEGCPFCGETPEVAKHFSEEMWRMVHRCRVMGPITIDWTGNLEGLVDQWNTRALPAAPSGEGEVERLREVLRTTAHCLNDLWEVSDHYCGWDVGAVLNEADAALPSDTGEEK